ncbi:MAG: arginase [Deltaproteobacteria bacterium]|nr:MAG: arginase [Deltaproteobacteria bacterium]
MSAGDDFDPAAAVPSDAGIFGRNISPEQAAVVLVPVPFDGTASYRPGAADGPRAMLRASHQIDLFDLETGSPWEAGIAMLEESEVVRAACRTAREAAGRARQASEDGADAEQEVHQESVDEACRRVNDYVGNTVDEWLARGKLVGTLGGDHGSVFAAIAAHAGRYPGMGILHIDAHADLRPAYEGFTWSHASVMHNVLQRAADVSRIVQVGVRDFSEQEYRVIEGSGGRVRTHFWPDLGRERLRGTPFSEQAARVVADLPDDVYVSFDIDGLSPELCPHTGTPVPGGLSFDEAVHLIREVAESGRRIVGFDLVEVAPNPSGDAGDESDEWDANVGMRILYKLIGWALRSQSTVP